MTTLWVPFWVVHPVKCDALQSGRNLPTILKNLLLQCSGWNNNSDIGKSISDYTLLHHRRTLFYPENGGGMFLRNVNKHLSVYTISSHCHRCYNFTYRNSFISHSVRYYNTKNFRSLLQPLCLYQNKSKWQNFDTWRHKHRKSSALSMSCAPCRLLHQ